MLTTVKLRSLREQVLAFRALVLFSRVATLCLAGIMAGCAVAPAPEQGLALKHEAPRLAMFFAAGPGSGETGGYAYAETDTAPSPRAASIGTDLRIKSARREKREPRRIERRQPAVSSQARTSAATSAVGIQPDVRRFVGAVGIVVKTLDAANAAFIVPKSIAAGEKQSIHLVLPVQAIERELRVASELPQDRAGGHARVRDRIEARLHGENFEITPVGPEARPFGLTEEIGWQWQVRPVRDGVHHLYLTVSVAVELQEQPITRVETFQRAMLVEVLPWPVRAYGFAREYWAWLWAAVVVPLAGWAGGKQSKPHPRLGPGKRALTAT